MIRLAIVMVLVSPVMAQRGMPGAPDENGVLSKNVCGSIEVVLDLPSVKAARGKIASEHYTADHAVYDSNKACRGAIDNLEKLCRDTRDENGNDTVPGKVKRVRCVVVDSGDVKDELKDGVWTVQFTLWSDANEMWDSKPRFPNGPNSLKQRLAKSLGLSISAPDPDDLFRGNSDGAPRCTSAKACASGLRCAHDDSSHGSGPRCVKAGPPTCSAGGDAFGHSDKACPRGMRCTQYGVCFPSSEFPVEGKRLPKRATCYLDRECASRACVGSGQDRFGTGKGTCR